MSIIIFMTIATVVLIILTFILIDRIAGNIVAPDECIPARCPNCMQLLDVRGVDIYYMLRQKVDHCPKCQSPISVKDGDVVIEMMASEF